MPKIATAAIPKPIFKNLNRNGDLDNFTAVPKTPPAKGL
jgi:hypothetical protein